MKKNLVMTIVLAATFVTFAQYKGKYEGWSIGYVFQGTPSGSVWKAFTHVANFQATISGTSANTGGLAMNSSSFVSLCHANGVKAIVCVGGQGESAHFSSACASASGQTALVKSIINIVKTYKYDGVDLDWEEGETGGFDNNTNSVAMFKSFHRELRDSINTITPRPLMTAAVATDWYPNGTSAIAPYVDQLNNMSYYNYVKDMNSLFAPVLKLGVPKKLQGVGFGWDTDNEVTDINDILAKCRYAIDSAYGGIMAWDITSAPTATLDSIARYVTHTATSTVTPFQMQTQRNGNLFVKNAGQTGSYEVVYSVPSDNGFVDLGVYDLKGAVVKTLIHGPQASGMASTSFSTTVSGAYILKLSTNSGTRSTKAFMIK